MASCIMQTPYLRTKLCFSNCTNNHSKWISKFEKLVVVLVPEKNKTQTNKQKMTWFVATNMKPEEAKFKLPF